MEDEKLESHVSLKFKERKCQSIKSLSTDYVLIKLCDRSLIKLFIVCLCSSLSYSASPDWKFSYRSIDDDQGTAKPNQYARQWTIVCCICTRDMYLFLRIPPQKTFPLTTNLTFLWPSFFSRPLLSHTQPTRPLTNERYNCPDEYHAKNLNLLKFISCPAENWTIHHRTDDEKNMGIFICDSEVNIGTG